MKRPKYSVIIPTLNEEKFLPKLLASLSSQTVKDFEVIVVDGSSRDKTVQKAKLYAKKLPSLTIVSSAPSLPLQRNLGAKEARGEWFVFVDADGEFLPYFFDRCGVYIQKYKPMFFTTWWRSDSEESRDSILALLADITMELTLVFRRQHAPGPLTIVSRDAYTKVGGYNESHSFTEDLDFGLRLGKAGHKGGVLRESLYIWSLRRMRREGTLRVVRSYAVAAALALVVQRAPKAMPGYIMGGHLYGRTRKRIRRSLLKKYEQKIKKLMKELFE